MLLTSHGLQRLHSRPMGPLVCDILRLVTQDLAHDQTITANRTELTGWQSGTRPCRSLAAQTRPARKENCLAHAKAGQLGHAPHSKPTPVEATDKPNIVVPGRGGEGGS